MTNLTLSLDEELVKRARMRAIGEGTSLSAKVREFLAGYAMATDQKQLAGQALLAAAAQSHANTEAATWNRDGLHDRPITVDKASP
jgi:plasmid stability protein